MEQSQIETALKDVVKHLSEIDGRKWEFVIDRECCTRYELHSADRLCIHASFGDRLTPNRWKFAPVFGPLSQYIRRYCNSSRNEDIRSITCAADKPPEKLAIDIARKLLTQQRDLRTALLNRRADEQTAREENDDAALMLETASRGMIRTERNRAVDNGSAIPFSLVGEHTGYFSGNISQHNGGHAYIQHGGLPIELLIRIAGTIADYYEEKEAEQVNTKTR